jgi:ERCC4-type nuclease
MIIVQDTREKQPWKWGNIGQIAQKLETGDYTVSGFEDLICVERKKSTTEIAINLGSKWERFEREFKRMESYIYKCIICEFSIDDILNFPKNVSLPPWQKKLIKINGRFMYKRLMENADIYGIDVFFCDDTQKAKQKAIVYIRNAVNDIKQSGFDG